MLEDSHITHLRPENVFSVFTQKEGSGTAKTKVENKDENENESEDEAEREGKRVDDEKYGSRTGFDPTVYEEGAAIGKNFLLSELGTGH